MDLSPYYYAIKFYRVVSKHFERSILRLEDNFNIWPSAYEQLKIWVLHVCKNPKFMIQKQTHRPHVCLYTDASKWGCGAVLIHRGSIRTFAKNWTDAEQHLSNNTRETLAVKKALEHFTTMTIGSHLTLFIDNITAKADITKKRSHDFVRNSVVHDIIKTLRQNNCSLAATKFISSEQNPADALSRGKPLCRLDEGMATPIGDPSSPLTEFSIQF